MTNAAIKKGDYLNKLIFFICCCCGENHAIQPGLKLYPSNYSHKVNDNPKGKWKEYRKAFKQKHECILKCRRVIVGFVLKFFSSQDDRTLF